MAWLFILIPDHSMTNPDLPLSVTGWRVFRRYLFVSVPSCCLAAMASIYSFHLMEGTPTRRWLICSIRLTCWRSTFYRLLLIVLMTFWRTLMTYSCRAIWFDDTIQPGGDSYSYTFIPFGIPSTCCLQFSINSDRFLLTDDDSFLQNCCLLFGTQRRRFHLTFDWFGHLSSHCSSVTGDDFPPHVIPRLFLFWLGDTVTLPFIIRYPGRLACSSVDWWLPFVDTGSNEGDDIHCSIPFLSTTTSVDHSWPFVWRRGRTILIIHSVDVTWLKAVTPTILHRYDVGGLLFRPYSVFGDQLVSACEGRRRLIVHSWCVVLMMMAIPRGWCRHANYSTTGGNYIVEVALRRPLALFRRIRRRWPLFYHLFVFMIQTGVCILFGKSDLRRSYIVYFGVCDTVMTCSVWRHFFIVKERKVRAITIRQWSKRDLFSPDVTGIIYSAYWGRILVVQPVFPSADDVFVVSVIILKASTSCWRISRHSIHSHSMMAGRVVFEGVSCVFR